MKHHSFRTLLPLLLWTVCLIPAAWGNSGPPVATTSEPDSAFFRGHLSIGPAAGSFTQCDTGGKYEINDRTGGEFMQVYEELANEPQAVMYVEFRGRKGLASAEGLGADYQEQLTILKLHHAAVESRGCAEDLQGFAFRAFGNKPFWHIAITAEGINFSEMGKPEIAFPTAIQSVTKNHWYYVTETAGPPMYGLAIDIREKTCRDTMSGAYFSYTARATLDNQTYTGCARQGLQRINQPKSHQKMTMTVTALKNADYSSEWSSTGKEQLNNGIYRERILPDSATKLVIRLGDRIAFGDLNNDGIDDAAVILITDGGGSGTFHDLVVLTDCNGTPKHVATASLGDRVRVQSLVIQSGHILLEMITHGPDDPMASPSLLVRRQDRLQQGTLVQIDKQN